LGQPPRHEQARPTSPPARHQPLPADPATLPSLSQEFWQTVDDGADALDIELAPALRAAIDAHVRLLIAWNEAINLTALRLPELIARGHVLDSLAAAETVDRFLSAPARPGERSMLDLGSGGGFPGLPLAFALRPGRVGLVDSVNKKAAFLRAAAEAGALAFAAAGEPAPQIDVFAERAEDLADEPQHRAGWSVVVARAVGSMSELGELALPLLAVGGHLVAWKRDADGALRAELDAARATISAVGGSRPAVRRVDPGGQLGLKDHVLVTVRKARQTPDGYPRQPAERRRAALLR
jgi:16S rRNA (guanine527-N7)-methyltransferase